MDDTKFALDSLLINQFTMREIADLGLTKPKALHNWLAKDLYQPLLPGWTPGGGKREFAMIDVIAIAAIHKLKEEAGLELTHARVVRDAIARRAVDLLAAQWGTRKVDTSPRVMVLNTGDEGIQTTTIRQDDLAKLSFNAESITIIFPLDAYIREMSFKLIARKMSETAVWEGSKGSALLRFEQVSKKLQEKHESDEMLALLSEHGYLKLALGKLATH